MSKQRIAIIGGGPAGLSAAFHLTRDPGWKDKLEITVYQLGWRLGGKGATGRDQHCGWRIEEHGIHGFCNFYFNTWRMMEEVYRELAQWPEELAKLPTKRIEDAFLGSSSSYHVERFGTAWHREIILAPRTSGRPWRDARADLDWKDVVRGIVRQMLRRGTDDRGDGDVVGPARALTDGLGDGLADLERLLERIHAIERQVDTWRAAGLRLVRRVPLLGRIVGKVNAFSEDTVLPLLLEGLDELMADHARLLEPLLERAQTRGEGRAYRSLVMLDFYLALFAGLLREGFWKPDFDLDRLDAIDFRDWLAQYGASRRFTLESAFLFGVPNILFAYPDGDCAKPPTLSTASWLSWTLRSLIGEGEYFYFMASGTGEAVVQPLYLLLERRGVHFEFFHKLIGTESEGAADGLTLKTLIFERQASTVDDQPYRPLVAVERAGFFAWPNAPRWECLKLREQLEGKVDFEEWGGPPPPGRSERRLVNGTDFHHVVWAIPPSMIGELKDPDMQKAWADVTAYLTTSATQAAQIWLTQPRADLGWTNPAMPLVPAHGGRYASAGFPNPLNAMVEFDDLLKFECWDQAHAPKGLIYLCAQIPRPPQGCTPDQNLARVRTNLEGSVAQLGYFFEKMQERGGGTIRSDLIYHHNRGSTIGQRLDYQYIRVNTRPTEAYVQAPPRNREGRLHAWESKYTNLVVAGDWIYTGLNLGAFESAVTGGKLAAFALRGSPAALAEIVGFDLFHPRARQDAEAALTAGLVPRIA